MNKFISLLIIVGTTGCDSSSTGAVDDFIAQMAEEQCAWEFRCCKDTEIKEMDGRKFTNLEACVPYRTLALVNQLYLNRLAAREGRLRVEGQRAEQCLGQLSAKACNPKPGTPAQMIDPMTIDACAKVFVGSTPIGNECIYASECVPGARCVQDAGAVGRGVCVPFQDETQICNADTDCNPRVRNIYCAKEDYHCRLRAKLGERCAWTTDPSGRNPILPLLIECDNSLGNVYCDPVSSTCRQLPAEGEPCLKTLPPGVAYACDPDPARQLVCDATGTAQTGICRAPGRLDDNCSRIPCGKELYCDSTARLCKTLPTLGQMCTASNYRCREPYYCNTAVSPYVCAEPASLGEPCGPSRICRVELYCDSTNQQCESKLPDGSVCTATLECLSNDCRLATGATEKTCHPRAGAQMCTGR